MSKIRSQKELWLPPCSLFGSLSERSQLPCSEDTQAALGKPHKAKNLTLSLTTTEGPRPPADSQLVCRDGSGSSGPLVAVALSKTQQQPPETLSQNHAAKLLLNSWLTKTEMMSSGWSCYLGAKYSQRYNSPVQGHQCVPPGLDGSSAAVQGHLMYPEQTEAQRKMGHPFPSLYHHIVQWLCSALEILQLHRGCTLLLHWWTVHHKLSASPRQFSVQPSLPTIIRKLHNNYVSVQKVSGKILYYQHIIFKSMSHVPTLNVQASSSNNGSFFRPHKFLIQLSPH